MKHLSIIAIRVLSVYLVASALNAGLPLFLMPESWGLTEGIPTFVLVGYIGLPIIIGFLLWFLAPRLSSKVPSENKEPLTENGLVSAGSFLIGVYLFVKHLGITIGQLHVISNREFQLDHFNWTSPVILGFSLFLIVGSKYIVLLFRKFRYFGNQA